MNILNTNRKNWSSFAMEKIKPPFDLSSNTLISYVYCKAYMKINCNGEEYDVDLLEKVFTEDELKRICSIYIEAVKDKEPENHDHFSRKDNAYNYSEIIHCFSQSLKHKPEIYLPILSYACKKKLDEKFNKYNPFSEITDSSFMQNFALAFGLQYYEVVFLCLNLINNRTHFLFNENMSDEGICDLFLQFFPIPIIYEKNFFQDMNNHLRKLGLFSYDWEVTDYVSSYFYWRHFPFKVQEVHSDKYGDCYSLDNISTENFDDLQVIDKIIGQCRNEKKGCYITVSNRNEYRIKNYVTSYSSYTVEITSDRQEFNKNSFVFFLVAVSCQLQPCKGTILIGSSLLKNFLPAQSESTTKITIYSEPEKYDGQNNTNEMIYSLFQYIQTPVFLLVNELDQNEINILNNNMKIVYRWNLKTPSENEYQEQFVKFLTEKDINADIIQVAANECNRLRVKSKEWNDVAEVLSVIDSVSESDVKQIIEANFEEQKNNHNIRKNSHYSLEALKTTEPVENIVKALKNAEKWQMSEYDSNSGIRILNYGISGTGKTAFVENVAKMLDRPLKIVRASDILGMYVGETEKNIKNTFWEAAKTSSILLIDEADSFLHCRGDNINHHNDSKVNEFLVQMERFPGILFCNTNLPDNLDSATDRRFHKKIGFNPLDKTGIKLLLKSYFNKFNFTDEQADQIYNSGDVTPGDFGALFGQLRFFAPEDLTSDSICDELIKMVKGKKRSWENTKTIGFGA